MVKISPHAKQPADAAANLSCDPFSYANDKSDSWSVSTDLTSDGDDSLDGDEAFVPLASQSSRRRSVRFSSVQVREYSVVEEPASTADDDTTACRRTLGWDYTEKGTSELDTHQEKIRNEKEDYYQSLIQDHIHRAESQEEKCKKRPQKRKGFRSKMLKPFWNGTKAAAHRFAVALFH